MNKKGASILITGISLFFIIIAVTALVYETLEKSDFDTYAGKDAQQLSNNKYQSYKQQFFIHDVTRGYFDRDFTITDVYNLQYQTDRIILQDSLGQYFDDYERAVKMALNEDFTSYVNKKVEEYNADARQRNANREEYQFPEFTTTNQEYSLYVENNNVKAIAHKKELYVDYLGNTYAYFPHASIDNTNIQDTLEYALTPITVKTEYQKCIRDTTSTNYIQGCKNILENNYPSITRFQVTETDNSIIKMVITFEETVEFYYEFPIN